MRIVIVGGGAIGRLFGSFLGKGNNEVTLIDIDHEVIGAMQSEGIGFMAQGGDSADDITSVPVTAFSSGSSVTGCDLVLLMVKSSATAAAIHSVAHLISESTPLLCIQTGLGNIETIAEEIPKEHLLVGITFMSGTALGGSKVRYGRSGKTYIGEINGEITPRLQAINQVFVDCGIETQMVQRIIGRLWCKVIVFSALNPLTSILKVPNGCLLAEAESVDMMTKLLNEGRAVAEAHGIDLVYPDLYPLLRDVCENSSNNLSSMLQDILNERNTEIDAQNGALVKHADEKGVSVPTQRTMMQLIKLLERWRPGLGQ